MHDIEHELMRHTNVAFNTTQLWNLGQCMQDNILPAPKMAAALVFVVEVDKSSNVGMPQQTLNVCGQISRQEDEKVNNSGKF
jgi:hypothetical protein